MEIWLPAAITGLVAIVVQVVGAVVTYKTNDAASKREDNRLHWQASRDAQRSHLERKEELYLRYLKATTAMLTQVRATYVFKSTGGAVFRMEEAETLRNAHVELALVSPDIHNVAEKLADQQSKFMDFSPSMVEHFASEWLQDTQVIVNKIANAMANDLALERQQQKSHTQPQLNEAPKRGETPKSD